MAKDYRDFPISRKEVWTIIEAALAVAIECGDWNTVGAIIAVRDKVDSLPEIPLTSPRK